MTLAPGARLGPYEIQAAIGAGGMGEVYRAKDTRLDRTVAIKALPTSLASDPARRRRFEREARAVVALFRGRPDITIDLLPTSVGVYGLGDLQNWFVRGEAYLALRQGREAAGECQAVLDHRGLDPFDCRWPLAHLGLARAMAPTGDTTKSRQMYEAFFALWKDADPDLPVLTQAKAEYARLR